ncbi:hypothetical protein NPIL_40811 [Nephila pilipes]|uniref:Uncharacterized protein n=1 Tax=Nephila pilipes TaxID=299642 RepID=A0A8X6PJU8_NEPPI|nr:hypothetical protein NPIL_40811 [Nephila pilipes]
MNTRTFVYGLLNIVSHFRYVLNALTPEAMSLYESLFSDCSDTLVESSSDEEMSVDYPPLVSFYGIWNLENVDSSSDTDHEVQSVLRVWKKRNTPTVIQNFFNEFRIN